MNQKIEINNVWFQEDKWPSEQLLAGLYILDSLKGFGPNKFKILFKSGIGPSDVLNHPDRLPIMGKIGEKLRENLSNIPIAKVDEAHDRARKQINIAKRMGASIITYGNNCYPKSVFMSNYPIPIIYVLRGSDLLANIRSVACVGSRKIRQPYSYLHSEFSKTACRQGFSISSGFALGADTIGHKVAYEMKVPTICVMPCGLDRPFPPENKSLWQSFLTYEKALLVSEFPFGMAASSLSLRKRNKLIVAFAIGLLVSQSSNKGGAMNSYRFAREQKKPVATFLTDGKEDTSGNKLISQELTFSDMVFNLSAGEKEFKEWILKL